jgi:hypothetical protein
MAKAVKKPVKKPSTKKTSEPEQPEPKGGYKTRVMKGRK